METFDQWAGQPLESPFSGRAAVVPLDEVGPVAVEWLWPGRIPLGKVTVLAGEGGVGKSLVALDIAARVSRGVPWPEEGGASGEGRGSSEAAGDVVLLVPEDGLGDTVRPRLDAAGADPARVAEVRVAGPTQVLPRRSFALAEHLDAVRDAVGMRGQVRLVVVDPVSAFVRRGARARRRDVEEVIWALGELAETTGAAVLAVMRLSAKAAPAAPRTVWAVAPDPGSPQRRLLVPVRNSLCAGVLGLACRVVGWPECPSVPRLAWERGAVRATAWEHGRRHRAAAWLCEVLAEGPLAGREVGRRAQRVGWSWASVRRAKGLLGIVAYLPGWQEPWMWRLPPRPGQPVCGAMTRNTEPHWATLGPDAANEPIRN